MTRSERSTAMRTDLHWASNWLARGGCLRDLARCWLCRWPLHCLQPPSARTAFRSPSWRAGGEQAATNGYNAALRIDLAVRALGYVDDRRALIAALAATK